MAEEVSSQRQQEATPESDASTPEDQAPAQAKEQVSSEVAAPESPNDAPGDSIEGAAPIAADDPPTAAPDDAPIPVEGTVADSPEPITDSIEEPVAEPIEDQASTEEDTTKESPPAEEKRPELEELEHTIEELQSLARACEKTLEETATLKDQGAIQKRLKQYSRELTHLPRALQKMNDFRRHLPDLRKRAETVRASLVKIRGGDDDAITSEEARIIVAVATATDTVIAVIQALENALGQVRSSTADLLSLISYEQPGFAKFAVARLRGIRVDLVSDIVHAQRRTVALLIEDLSSLAALEEHIAELEHA